MEFLTEDPNFERVFLFYKPSLDRLGIGVTVRTVDEAQYQNRLRSWDFDIITNTRQSRCLPATSSAATGASQAADQSGSANLISIRIRPSIAMIDEVIFAKSRADLVAATKALDRVLLWNHCHVVPRMRPTANSAARPLGPFWPPRSAAAIRQLRLPEHLVDAQKAAKTRRLGREDGTDFARRLPRSPASGGVPSRAKQQSAQRRRSSMSKLTRRRALVLAGGVSPWRRRTAACSPPLPTRRSNRTASRRSAISTHEPRLPAYVEPNAPKGGTFPADRPEPAVQPEFPHLQLAQQRYILRGDAAQGMEPHLRHAHGACRRRRRMPFTALRPKKSGVGRRPSPTASFCGAQAQFHDGTRLTAHDVAFSLNTLEGQGTRSSPNRCATPRREATDDAIVVARFAPKRAPRRAAIRRRRCRSYRAPTTRAKLRFDETTLDGAARLRP